MSETLKVLLAEDSEPDALLIARELGKQGFEPCCRRVEDASSFAEALDSEQWDVILSDFQMPQFTGLDAFEILKEKGIDVPFVIISGFVGEEVAVTAMRAGVHDYLMKDNLARLGPAIRREMREVEVRVQRRQAVKRQGLHSRVLSLLNSGGESRLLLENLLNEIKSYTGFDAVGIRLKEGDDYPYFVQHGFDDEFVRQEMYLACAEDGTVQRDEAGRPILECTCGLVLSGRPPADSPFFTPEGSFFSNDTSSLLDLPLEQDPRHRPRNRCIDQGYRSVALIPLRSGDETIGLLQLNDSHTECFSVDMIQFFEQIGNSIGVALKRTRAEEALRASEDKFRSIVDRVGIGVALISPEMEILELNRQMREWLPDVDPSQHPICYQACNDPPRDSVCDNCPAAKTFHDGKVHEATIDAQRADSVRNYRVVTSPILNADGEVTAAIEMVEDMTERQRLETRMRQSEKLESMGTLASGVAHDINNSLAPMTLYTDVMLEENDIGEQSRQFLKIIQDSIKDIEGTISRLRMFYRRDDGDESERRSIVLSSLLKQVVDMTRPRWRDVPQRTGATIDITTEIPNRCLAVNGIESELRAALMNLVFNAVDAMPKGGTLGLRAVVREPNVVLEVEDTGVGMSAEHIGKCLEPFYTTKGTRGTGLGLSTVFGTMQRHQGEMEIDSEEGKGTTVRLIFPIRHPEQHEQVSETSCLALASLRILCIDDDRAVRKGLKQILERDGHRVVDTESGERGVKAIEQAMQEKEEFDVVITDLGMPDMDGWEVAEQVKKRTADTPVLLLSGWGNLMTADEKESQLVDAVLAKPPRINELRQVLQAMSAKSLERNTSSGA